MKSFIYKPSNLGLVLLVMSTLLFFGCATMSELAQVSKPTLSMKKVRVSSLSFEDVNLEFDVRIKNPNPFSIALAGFTYDMMINNNRFVQGNQTLGLNIASRGKSLVKVPVRLNYRELYKTYHSLKGKDSFDYAMACGMKFNLPVLGMMTVPVQKKGELPIPKAPRININGLKLKSMNLSGADLALEMQVDNPNVFDLIIKGLNYGLTVNGKSWARGFSSNRTAISKKGRSIIQIPLSIDLMTLGKSAYTILSGNQLVQYKFQGDLDLGTSLPIMDAVKLPYSSSGKLLIAK